MRFSIVVKKWSFDEIQNIVEWLSKRNEIGEITNLQLYFKDNKTNASAKMLEDTQLNAISDIIVKKTKNKMSAMLVWVQPTCGTRRSINDYVYA